MKVLLIEPKTSGKFIPLGLLKIGAYAKRKGYTVQLVRLNKGYPNVNHFDIAYVTSLFTWEWKEVWKAVKWAKLHADKVILGGIYASLLPEHAEKSGADKVIVGSLPELDLIRPAYELIPECDYSIVFMSRGCIRKCKFCAVPRIEGKLREFEPEILRKLIYPKHRKVIMLDNNILAHKKWDELYIEMRKLNKTYDLHGVDSRLISDKKAEQLSKLNLHADNYTSLRLGFDDMHYKKHAEKAAKLLSEHGIHTRRIMYYCLYNFMDTPDDFFERVRLITSWGCVAFPMRYQSIHLPHALKKDSYIGEHWTERELKLVDDFIWKYGQGGAIPPYLSEHFNKSNDFYEAFGGTLHTKKLSDFM